MKPTEYKITTLKIKTTSVVGSLAIAGQISLLGPVFPQQINLPLI